ncbi:MAG: prepilin peptidase [Gammaproteobacteria bacterium]
MNLDATLAQVDPRALIAAFSVLGLLVGSFLNVVIHRLPIMMEREWRRECRELLEDSGAGTEPAATAEPEFNLMRPRSRCPSCEAQISALDNVPVLSWLALRGRCRRCGAPIAARYPLVEAFSGLTTGWAAWTFGADAGVVTTASLVACLAAALFCWYLIALALIDYDTKFLPDSMTLPLMWFGITLGFFGLFAPDLESAVIGAMAGYLSLWSVYHVFRLVTGKEGMGYGDFKLLAALAAWLGWQALPALILVSAGVGAVIGVGMIVTGAIKRAEPIPFGPYLALAGIIMLFFGEGVQGLLSPGGAL